MNCRLTKKPIKATDEHLSTFRIRKFSTQIQMKNGNFVVTPLNKVFWNRLWRGFPSLVQVPGKDRLTKASLATLCLAEN